jgi:hypothetical protein
MKHECKAHTMNRDFVEDLAKLLILGVTVSIKFYTCVLKYCLDLIH